MEENNSDDDLDLADLEDELEDKIAAASGDRYRELATRYAHRVNLDRGEAGRRKDKSDRSTAERALDPVVLRILYKLLEQGRIREISGCISTGKEANVYHAESADGELALKVFMTSIQQFRKRGNYVEGDWRLRRTRYAGSSRQKIREWAHKELMNLKRISRCELVPSPEPVLLKGVVLLMSFLGHDGVASPRLKDADLSEEEAEDAYRQTCLLIRRLYQRCKLVHADCNEYNLLWHDGKVHVIDVGQSVECERHPSALKFLREDCSHVTIFFGKHLGVRPVFTAEMLFNFVTDTNVPVTPADEIRCLDDRLMNTDQLADTDLVDVAFLELHIPRRLEELNVDDRRVRERMKTRDGQMFITVTGTDLTGAQCHSSSSSTSSGDDDDDDDYNHEDGRSPESRVGVSGSAIGRPRDESPASKAARKSAVKLAKKEKRETKIPKHEKKRKEKLGKKKSGRK